MVWLDTKVTLNVLLFQLGFTLGNVVGMFLAQNYDVSDHFRALLASMYLIFVILVKYGALRCKYDPCIYMRGKY